MEKNTNWISKSKLTVGIWRYYGMWWIILWVLGGVVVLYVLVAVGYYLNQERLIFFPDQLETSHQFQFPHPFQEIHLEIRPGVEVNGVLFKVERPVGVVHFHHGNARNLEDWGWKYERFTQLGFDVFFYDYRTFGKSKGPLSERALHKDAMVTYKYLASKYPGSRIVQYGASLGSGIATKLAKKVKSPLLLLETPYLSMLAMAEKVAPFLPNKWILKYPIRTDFWIKKVPAPIFLFHGTQDEMIPYSQAEKLASSSKTATLFTIEGGHHNDLDQFDSYHIHLCKVLIDFAMSLPRKEPKAID